MKRDRLLERAVEFHGHLGPWLALGLKAGRRAKRVLGSHPFLLRATVHCPKRTPYTCFIDGVQFASGCTMGKGNIRHVRSSRVRVEFCRHAGPPSRFMPGNLGNVKAGLVLELRPEVWTELHLERPRTRARVESLGRSIYSRPFSRLFVETR